MKEQSKQLNITISSALLIGGYSNTNIFADKSTARQRSGLPIIPASVIKGAIRMEYERIFNKLDCMRKEKCDCSACKIFGSEGDNPGLITFTDGVLKKEYENIFIEQDKKDRKIILRPTGIGYTERSGVVINRKTKTSEEKKLFLFETTDIFSQNKKLEFTAEIHIAPQWKIESYDKELWQELKAAVSAVFAIGGSKSRGMGFCEFTILEPEKQTYEIIQTELTSSVIKVHLSLQGRHISIGEDKPYQRFLQTKDYIPGATLRGALAKAIINQTSPLPDIDISDTLKNTFVDSGAIFDDCLISKGKQPAYIVPLSARECKSNRGFRKDDKNNLEEAHGITDVVIRDLLAESACLPVTEQLRCSQCEGKMTHVSSTYYYRTEGTLHDCKSLSASKRVVTRSAQSRKLHNSQEGQLFSIESLEKPDRGSLNFVGTIRMVNNEMLSTLKRWQNQLIRIGAETSTGYGMVKINLENLEDSKALKKESICRRFLDFNETIQKEFKKLQNKWKNFCKIEQQHKEALYLTINLLSHTIWIDKEKGIYAGLLPEEFLFNGIKAKRIRSYAKAELLSGWNFKLCLSGCCTQPHFLVISQKMAAECNTENHPQVLLNLKAWR